MKSTAIKTTKNHKVGACVGCARHTVLTWGYRCPTCAVRWFETGK